MASLEPGSRARARLMVLAELGALVFTVVLRYWTTRGRYVYSVTADEASELAIARTLSGSRPFHVLGPSYDAGFGVLVAPIYAVVEDPELAFRLVLMTNVVLAAVTVLVLRALLVRLLDLPGPVATWSGAIAVALPGAAMQTPFTGSEVLVVLVVALGLLLSVMLDSRGAWWPALGFATVSASMVLVHSRLTAVVAATAVILVASSLLGETPRRTAGVAVVLLVVLAWAAWQFNDWVYDLVWLPGSPESSERLSAILEKLRSPGAVLASIAGMSWHQMVTTFGLVVVGLGHLLVTGVRGIGTPGLGARAGQAWKILLILAAAAGPAAVFMSGAGRASKMVYGRYWDALAVPVVAIGVGYLLQVGFRRASRAFATAILVVGGTGVAFFLARQDAITAAFERRGFGNPRRIAGLLTFVAPGDAINVAAITVLALVAMAGVLAVVVLGRRHHELATVVVLVGVATAATVRASIHLNEGGLGLTRWRPAMELVEDGIVPDDATVAFQLDKASYDFDPRFPFTAYQFYEPDVEFVGLEGEDVLDHDWVVSSGSDPLMQEQGWEVVFEHPNGRGVAVWTEP